MTTPLLPLFERLPEIHRTKDGEPEGEGKDQLRAFLDLIDAAFGAIHADIWRLYDDLFVETASDWAVPYIGDLLGTSPLSGDPWTIRADVADTIALRRRKGTLAAIERLTFDLTGWAIHAIELRENLAWSQHLNHLRPDLGEGAGVSPPGPGLAAPRRGGTVTLRDSALLSLIGTPFDPFAHLADLRAPGLGSIRYNLPNLAIFLWRLAPYRIALTKPGAASVRSPAPSAAATPRAAARLVRVEVDPLARPVRLFNRGGGSRDEALGCCDHETPGTPDTLTELDQAPGPILAPRLTDDTPAGNPAAYVAVDPYDPASPAATRDLAAAGLQLFVPEASFGTGSWQFRAANLCAWERGLDAPLLDREIAIDPVIGRLLVGVASGAEAAALRRDLRLGFTTGAAGPVGAQPHDRPDAPEAWNHEPFDAVRLVDGHGSGPTLADELGGLDTAARPVIVEIADSLVHDLDLATVAGTVLEDGGPNLALARTVIVRAANGERPIIRLAQPLRVRPAAVVAASPKDQRELDERNQHLALRLEGLFLTRGEGFPAGSPLIARAALNRLELHGCTLDPGGWRERDGTRTAVQASIALHAGHGFAQPADATAFRETPVIEVRRAIVGAILADDDYTLELWDSIVDAGAGPADPPGALAVGNATDPVNGWAPPVTVARVTFLGGARVERIEEASGAIWTQSLLVHDDQVGCIRLSYLSGAGDRIPRNVECVRGTDARLRFTSVAFGDPGYGQLARTTDFRVLERGPGDDEMGAYGFLREAHKWRNLQVRFREFMPLGIRPLLVPVT
ncbi:MAG: hypothetical protein A2V85_03025 [Chloroflexi bacterium RBG_16_72_14]|nr:MAG: hypothetical protein A2V85_03025 [Chloroflexi bacterium RBG_16_72_14]